MIARPSLATLLLALGLAAPAAASNAFVSAYSNDRGEFGVVANNLNRVTEAELRINYQSDKPTPPLVSGPYPNEQFTFAAQAAGGSISIKLACIQPCKIPLSGYKLLAIADIQGTISSLTAVLRYENGTTESARVSITNPTAEQLSQKMAADAAAEEARQVATRQEKERLDAEAASLAAAKQERLDAETARLAAVKQERDRLEAEKAQRAAESSPGQPTAKSTTTDTDSVSSSADRQRDKQATDKTFPPSPETAPHEEERTSAVTAEDSRHLDTESAQAISFSRRGSVQERFHGYAGERSITDLARLFERSDEMFTQEPLLLLSDGSATLRLTVRIRKRSERAPQFFISEAACTDLKIGTNDGVWVLELVPKAGSLTASVTVLTGSEMIDFPLAVAPPLEIFDEALARAGDAEYVRAANRLVSGR